MAGVGPGGRPQHAPAQEYADIPRPPRFGQHPGTATAGNSTGYRASYNGGAPTYAYGTSPNSDPYLGHSPRAAPGPGTGLVVRGAPPPLPAKVPLERREMQGGYRNGNGNGNGYRQEGGYEYGYGAAAGGEMERVGERFERMEVGRERGERSGRRGY